MRKRNFVSSVVATALFVTSIPVHATETIEQQPDIDIDTIEQSLEQNEQHTVEGTIELELYVDASIIDESKIIITLLPEFGEAQITTLNESTDRIQIKRLNHMRQPIAKEEKASFYHITFSNLSLGNYTVSLDALGYIPFEQKVAVETTSQRLVVGSHTTTVGEVNIPGVFLSGDVNADRTISQEDYDLTLQHMNSVVNEETQQFDLNKDGQIDVADLVIIHSNLNAEVQTVVSEATNPIIDPSNVSAEAISGTLIGNIQDLFTSTQQTVTVSSESEISTENPVEILMNLATHQTTYNTDSLHAEKIILTAPTQSAPTQGVLTINGEPYPFTTDEVQTITDTNQDIITIDLGKQVALSEITITITGSKGNKNLAEIAKIELLNNVYQEIPAPEMNIPVITNIESSIDVYGGILDVTWDAVSNITGYELKLQEVDNNGNVKSTKVYQTKETHLRLEKLNSYATYRLTMQSLNREWKSGEKEPTLEDIDGLPENVTSELTPIPWEADSIVEFQIIPSTVPDRPEGISVTGEMKGLTVSWKQNKKALEQRVEYRKIGTEEWTVASEEWVGGTSFRINDLEEAATYEIRMQAKNHLGVSDYSVMYIGTTKTVQIPTIPTYGLINHSLGQGSLSAGIESVRYHSSAIVSTPEAVVDNEGLTYFQVNDWDTGIYSNRGPIVTFKETQTIDTISLVKRLDTNSSTPYTVEVRYLDEGDGTWKDLGTTLESKNGYIFIKLPHAIQTKEIQINPSVYGSGYVTISELRFYEHGTLEQEINDLFTDALQLELRENVTLSEIEALEIRVNTLDPINLEYHPNRTVLLEELQRAKDLYQDVLLSDEIITIDTSIQSGSTALSISNKWQSLGYTVRSGDEITVYVGTSDAGRKVELAVRQPFAESGKYQSTTVTLQPGKNTITIPNIHSLDAENGGTLYVRTTWDNEKSQPTYKIRVSGATKVPMLNVNNVIGDETEMKNRIRTYIRELKTFVPNLPNLYTDQKDPANNIYPYDEATSVMNSTDIEGDRFTLTIPTTQVLKGITDGLSSEDDQVERLYNTILAWEQFVMMTYAKKGVYETALDLNSDGTIDTEEANFFKQNRAPRTRINIKYQRMFAGAAGYASSDHIGIQFGLVPSLMQGIPYQIDENGSVLNADEAKFFGWLIAHEMGHVVDISKRTYSEVSNNILSLISQTFDDQDESRLESSGMYAKIYDKVTSGSVGISSDVFVTLGMFWQLQLAYENQSTAAILQTSFDDDLSNDSYYTKMNQLYRSLSSEMQKLDKDQLLIRVASDAAQRDLRGFFQAWGIQADSDTAIYLTQKGYQQETRPIQYLNDQARRMRLANEGVMAEGTTTKATFLDGITDGDRVSANTVPLSLTTSQSQESILGYEIIVNGEVAGFVESTGDVTTYHFNPSPLNNRVFSIDIRAYDYHLNAAEVAHVGTIKIAHDGRISKTSWSVSSNETVAEHSNSDMNTSIQTAIDNDSTTAHTVQKTSGDPYIIIDMNKNAPLVGFRYTAPVSENANVLTKLFSSQKIASDALSNYVIQVSTDGQEWTQVSSGRMNVNSQNPTQTIYFEKPGTSGGNQYWMQNAQYVKIIAKGATSFSVAELDLLSPTGDNIEIGIEQADGQFTNGVGTLKTAFEYAPGKSIPAGSLIVTGSYRGYPIYNVPLVLDENNDNIAYNAKAIVLAELPEGTVPTEVANGSWIYWIEPQHLAEFTATSIVAELYRINDIATLDGQRLVSDTFTIDVPEVLPEIEFTQSMLRMVNHVQEFSTTDLENVKEQANEKTE